MRRAILLGLSVWVAPLDAQAPVITPDGDPSVLSDTIYSLAIDASERPEEDQLRLLDDGVFIVQHDGTDTRTYRTVTQVLTREAVEQWAEHTFTYDAVRQDFRLNWARVVSPDGEIVSSEPVYQQLMDAPVPEANPVFTDRKRVRISLGGVEPGNIVDYSYTMIRRDTVGPGGLAASWTISSTATVLRSRLLVDVPADYDLRTMSSPNTVEPVVRLAGDRRVYEWAASNLDRFESEAFDSQVDRHDYQRVRLAAPATWDEVGVWYSGLVRNRYVLTDEVLSAAEEEVGDLQGVEALRALHRWIAQDFRYLSISLGAAGYQPRFPAQVLEAMAGDCKDKAVLFIALARHYGFEAYPVLLLLNGTVWRTMPNIDQFNHMVAAVRIGGEWVYLDLTAVVVPFGEVPPSYEGRFGLVVFDEGAVEEVTFPESAVESNLSVHSVTGELFDDGRFEGRYSEVHTGANQYPMREAFAQDFTRQELRLIAQRSAGIIDGGVSDEAEVPRGLDLDAEVRFSLDLSSSQATRPNIGGGYIFILPMVNYANPALVTEVEDEVPTRISPIDIEEVVGRITTVWELKLRLPEGWSAALPDEVAAETQFGTYEARYEQTGRELSITRRISGGSGTAPKEALPELIEFLSEISRDNVPFVLLQPAR